MRSAEEGVCSDPGVMAQSWGEAVSGLGFRVQGLSSAVRDQVNSSYE